MPRRLLLLSNSRDAEGRYLHHPRAAIRDFLGAGVRQLLFVPYAGVTITWDDYEARAGAAFAEMGYRLESVHRTRDPAAAARAAAGLVVGGGNTFHLLARLYEHGLVDVLRARALAGVPYIGWSAGSVVACPTIRTTNDMPIVEPPSLDALGLVPFQLNAHYTDFHPPGFRGETRAERLAEFIAANPGLRVLGLPEGTMLRVEGDRIELLGAGECDPPVFEHGRDVRRVRAGDELGFLLAPS